MKRTILAACLAAALAPPALAQRPPVEVDIGGRRVRLVVADGQCPLDKSVAADARIVDLATRAIAGQNELLLHTAECRNLADVRAGRARTLVDFGQAQVSLQLKGVELAGQEAQSAHVVCNEFRSKGSELERNVGQDIKERVKNLREGIAVNETRSLGVLAEDDTACYSGVLLNIRDTDTTARLIVGVFAITVLNGRMVFLYRYSSEPRDGTVQTLLELQQRTVREHWALNNASRPQSGGPPAANQQQPTQPPGNPQQPATKRTRLY